MTMQNWESKAKVARDILAKSIKTEWLIPKQKLPEKDILNVLLVAEESGILSKDEILITETDATGLVEKMGAGEWKAEQVLIAFTKRATIGHQLVRNTFIHLMRY
jgi:amidase